MATINTEDAPVQESTILSMLEERTEDTRQFRRAFRDYDATNHDERELEFPIPEDDFEGEMVEISDNGDYPRAGLNYGEVSAVEAKYGFEVTISDDAQRFSRIDLEADAQAEMMDEQERAVDQQGYNLLDAQNNDATVGSDGTDLNYPAIVEGWTTLFGDQYNPSQFEIYVGPDGVSDLSQDDNFNRATQGGDDLVRSDGIDAIGEIYDTPVFPANTGLLGEDEALMVDVSKYGRLATWDPTDVESYREPQNDQWVYKINGRWGFAVTDPQAAVFIQGGVSSS